MRLQSNEATCGACMVSNGLKALGFFITEAQVVKKAGPRTEVEGTSESHAAKCLRALRAWHSDFTLSNPDAAWAVLRWHLSEGRAVGLAVDKDDHWIVAVGTLGARVLVVDSADPECTLSYTRDELLERWETPGDPVVRYGIAMKVPRRKR